MTAKIRTLIADDEPAAREAIALLLGQDPDIELVGSCADGGATLAAIQELAPDLVFLDVRMPGLDGFSVLGALDESEVPAVVFVTAWNQYALNAFDARALDYVLKPFDDDRFHQAVTRAKQRVREERVETRSRQLMEALTAAGLAETPGAAPAAGPLKRIVIRANGRIAVVKVADIDWIEADGDNLRIHAGRQVHTLREALHRFEASLDPELFVRVHRSTIVNVDRIQGLEPYYRGEYVVILADGTRLKLSRNCKARLVAVLGREF